MGHPTIFLSSLLLLLVGFLTLSVQSSRPPSAIPFPHKEELEYLTSEEEERLIYGGDESVIMSKIRDLPDGLIHPPNPKKLPVPTMDPPLPEIIKRGKRPQKSNRGFPFRIPRVFLKQGARMITPLNRKPRTRMGSEVPVPSFRARPSTLVSSEPDQLEVAFKRIEIMASRAGLNMSAMPRRTQMQVLKRLIPKLPPKLSNLVKNEMKDHSTKMYQYLPESMKDPLIDDTQTFVSSYAEDDDPLSSHSIVDDFSDFSIQTPVAKRPVDFDASKISITNEDIAESHELFSHLPSITTEKYGDEDKGNPSFVLIPPSELHDDIHHDYSSHKYETGSSHHLERGSLYSREVKQHETPSYTQIKHASSSLPDYLDTQSSDNLPSIITTGSFKPPQAVRKDKSVSISTIKNATPLPLRTVAALPSKDRFVKISPKTTKFHNFTEPIRVSIISKDKISINRSSDPFVKVIHIEEVKPEETNNKSQEGEEVSAIVQEVKEESNPIADNEAHKQQQLTRVKLISKDVIKAEEDKYKLSQEKSRSRATTTTSTTTTSTTARPSSTKDSELPPDIVLKLDNYDDNDWMESTNYDVEDLWADQYDLTDEEIAATVAELKKYEEQSAIDNSLEQEYPWRLTPHPLEYPDHPDHPKDSPEESKLDNKDKKPDSSNSNLPIKRPHPEHSRRPGFGGGYPRRPPMMRRPPFKRPPPHHRRPPLRPMGPRPLRINDVTVSEIPKEYSKECDYFSDNLCLVVQDYPIEAISEAIEQHPDIASVLVKEPEMERNWVDGVPKSQENHYNFKHYFGQRKSEDETTHRHRDFAGEGGFLCPSKVAYGQVKKAKSSSSGEWKYVVNFGENTQTLRLEKCLSPGNTCSYVMPHYRTACTQVHNYHRLLAWDSEKGLHMDVFKIPTCCTCHVQGYYIPQQAQALGFSPARRRDLPPKLNFAPPPRGPFARGGRRIPQPPSLLTPVPNGHSKPAAPAVVVTDLSTKPNDKTKEHAIASSAKELKEDLHDLLAQYSALRERIAKKKNENIHVSYSTSISNSTDALKPKKRGSRNPTKLKPLLQLKKLQLMSLKKMNMTTKNGKLKRPLARARAMLIARLNRKLKSARSGRAMRQQLNRLGDDNKNGGSSGSGGGGILSMENLKNRIQLLRSRLNKYNERSKMKPRPAPTSMEESLQERIHKSRISNSNNVHNSNINNNNYNNSNSSKASTTSQRLRLSSNRPSKVNYSYHPIMDYFNSKTRLNN